MRKRLAIGTMLAVSALLLAVAAGSAQPDTEFVARPTWELATSDAVFEQLSKFLTDSRLPPETQAAARNGWSANSGEHESPELLDRLVVAIAPTDERVAALISHCSATQARGPLTDFAWLADSETPQLVRYNMRLYLARWLVQTGYYDEAISWMSGLKPSDVVAPEALLFYQAVAYQRLVEPDMAAAALGELMSRRDALPVRYQKLADLMRRIWPHLKMSPSNTLPAAWRMFAAAWRWAALVSACRKSKRA